MAGEPDGLPNPDSRERILQAATLLFAERGYHGVSTRDIARAVGLNVSTVHYHAGGKEDLYREVFRRLYLKELDLVSRFAGYVDESVVGDPEALRRLLERLVDALIDMTLASPEVPRLWVRRWLEREFHWDEIEAQFSLPLYEMVRNLLDRARRAGSLVEPQPDFRLLMISVTWILYGYFTGGPIAWNLADSDPFAPEQISAFRGFMHAYVRRMLGL